MKLKLNFQRFDMNWHDGDGGVILTGHKTVKGPKFRLVNVLDTIRRVEKSHPEGGKTRALWYKRLIFYFPSGAWWGLDIVLVRPYEHAGIGN